MCIMVYNVQCYIGCSQYSTRTHTHTPFNSVPPPPPPPCPSASVIHHHSVQRWTSCLQINGWQLRVRPLALHVLYDFSLTRLGHRCTSRVRPVYHTGVSHTWVVWGLGHRCTYCVPHWSVTYLGWGGDLLVHVCGHYFWSCIPVRVRRSPLLMNEIVPILFHTDWYLFVVVLSRVGIFSIFYSVWE
jgi:hypothetical protein